MSPRHAPRDEQESVLFTRAALSTGGRAKSVFLSVFLSVAPTERDYPGVYTARLELSKPQPRIDPTVWEKAKKEIGTVTIDIPGDGKSTILNHPRSAQSGSEQSFCTIGRGEAGGKAET